MSASQFSFERHDTHIFCCWTEPNPFAFQLTFPLPIPSTSRARSPANAWAICVPSPGFHPTLSPQNRVDFHPMDDVENRENWKFFYVRVTPRVIQTWLQQGREKFLAGTCLLLFPGSQYGTFTDVDVQYFLSSIGDEDYFQRSTGTAPNYSEAALKVLYLESSNRQHFLYARVNGLVQKFIFNRRRCRFELLREQENMVTMTEANVFRRSDDVLMKSSNATIVRNREGFLETRVNGRKIRPSQVFLEREKVKYEEDVEEEESEESEEEESDEEEEEEEEEEPTVYSDGEVPKVEHEEEVMAEEHDYFRWNEIVTDSSSDDDDQEIIVVD